MLRYVTAFLLLLPACAARMHVEFAPSLISHVPDSTLVRFSTPLSRPAAAGRALGWQAGTPRVVTPQGDTLVPPADARLEVSTGRHGSYAVYGGIMGWLVGIGISLGTCDTDIRYCGEQDVRPLLGAFVGALVGHAFKREKWVTVTPDSLASRPAPGTALGIGPSRGDKVP